MVGIGWAEFMEWSGLSLLEGSPFPWLSSTSNGEGSEGGDPESLGRIVWDSSGEGTWSGSLPRGEGLPLFCGDVVGVGGVGWSHMVAS